MTLLLREGIMPPSLLERVAMYFRGEVFAENLFLYATLSTFDYSIYLVGDWRDTIMILCFREQSVSVFVCLCRTLSDVRLSSDDSHMGESDITDSSLKIE